MTAFDGVDLQAVQERLASAMEELRPVNGSSGGIITTRDHPACGRNRAMIVSESLRPIFERLYPTWREEIQADKRFEFRQEYDAAHRLTARIALAEENRLLFPDEPYAPTLNAHLLFPAVWDAARVQWETGHRHEAVLAAAKIVNSLLQKKVGRRDISEVKLVRDCFSEKAPTAGHPRLRFTAVLDDQTRESLRDGVMSFGAGCFMAIRNPVGHLPNEDVDLSEQEALERLAALSLLARWIEQADLETVS